MKINQIHINPDNPRLIKDDRFKKLCKSISDFPKMMELRPIIIDNEGMILGGNMRFKALKELKYKDIPDRWVKRADELTEAEKQEFIVKDNVGFGDWDFNSLENWDKDQLIDWGMELPEFINGEIVELDDIVTTFNINIKCDTPDELEKMKFKLGITANSIHSTMLERLLA